MANFDVGFCVHFECVACSVFRDPPPQSVSVLADQIQDCVPTGLDGAETGESSQVLSVCQLGCLLQGYTGFLFSLLLPGL